MISRRAVRCAGVALGLIAATGAVALPAEPADAAVPAQVRVAGSGTGAALQYRSSDVGVNKILIEPNGPGFNIVDLVGTMVLDTSNAGGCIQGTARLVYCPQRLRLYLELGAGNDTFDNTLGADLYTLLWAGDGNDTIASGSHDDELHGGDGRDTIYGGAGWDHVYGGAADDKLYGEDGHDLLDGEGGNDKVWGGSGDDLLVNPHRTRDEFHGDDGDDVLDTANRLWAGAGDDVIWVNAGFGDYYGEAGNDTINYTYWPYARVDVSLDGNDNDGVFAWDCPWWVNCPDIEARHNVHGDFETVIGSPGDDGIKGNNEPDILLGGAGSDNLKGNGGDDHLDAGPGTSQGTDGGTGTDTCRGENLARTPGCDNF